MNIPFQNIQNIPQLIKDFLHQDISTFEKLKFSIDQAFKHAEIKEKSFLPQQREVLCSVLQEQHSSLELSEKQKENLKLLEDPRTFTVVTGHQLNLFSGPVFFVYKILQTIKTAALLSEKSTDKKFIPIFWMATEDHDFEEINHFQTENNLFQIKAKSGGPVGRIAIEENDFLEEFENVFKDEVYGTELILWMKEAYRKGNTLSEATRILVNRLFGSWGLLMIDGDDARLKQSMESIFLDELKNQSLKESTKKTVASLEEKYGKVQVNPRDINLFYLSETRDRIEAHGEHYRVIDTDLEFSLQEVQKQIPHLSPNALMRPVYQEKILPNIAYIGGNAEIAYWLELKNYFEKLYLPFPILIPRNSLLFLKEKTIKKIEKTGLHIEDFFGDYAQVMREKLLDNSEISSILNQKQKEIKEAFSVLKSKAEITDKTFKNLVEAEETRQLKSYTRMQKRLLRAEKIKQNEKYTYLQQLFLEVHPSGTWQERLYNFSVFYAQNGRQWLNACYEKIDVEKSALIISEI